MDSLVRKPRYRQEQTLPPQMFFFTTDCEISEETVMFPTAD